jgi:hypothetical protein
MSSTSSTPRLDALLLLDAYQTAHRQANAELKSSVWGITVARREKPDIGATNIRPDLESLVRVMEDDSEPALQHESLTLVDVAEKQQQEKENAGRVDLLTSSVATMGLRNRHSKTDYSSTTQDYDKDEKKSSMIQEEAENKGQTMADPLQLLGGALPPRGLKDAQVHAKNALESYLQAANIVRELQKLISTQRIEKR